MKQFFSLFFLLLFAALSAVAQTGTVRGRVLADGRPAELVTVALAGTSIGTSTDAQGRYELRDAPAGDQQLVFSSVGYETQRRRLTIVAGQPVTADATLRSTTAELSEVVVTGVSRATEIRRSPVPVAALTGREIRLNANSNAIDAAVRGVPGLAAVTTGPNISKPFIRGLGYNRVLTLFNGLRQEGQQWGDEHGIEVDGYGLDRVEVVKGPASLLYAPMPWPG